MEQYSILQFLNGHHKVFFSCKAVVGYNGTWKNENGTIDIHNEYETHKTKFMESNCEEGESRNKLQ